MRKRDQLFVLKYCLNVLNGIFLVLGLMLVAFGLWILLENNIFFSLLKSMKGSRQLELQDCKARLWIYTSFIPLVSIYTNRAAVSVNNGLLFQLSTDDEHSLALFSHLLLVTGSITVVTGFLGCLGSLHEIRCLIIMYIGLLVLILGLQSTILVLTYTRQEMIKALWKAQLDELISSYGNKNLTEKEHQWAILDDFQHMEHCCGRHNISDWKLNKYKEHDSQVPCSCTTLNTKQRFCDALKYAIYIKGCEEYTKIWFEKNIWVLISINSGLLSVEVLQFLIAACLFKLTKKTQILPKK